MKYCASTLAASDFPTPPFPCNDIWIAQPAFPPLALHISNPSLTKAWEKGFSDSQRQKILSGSGGSPVKFWNPRTLFRYSMAVASGFGREIARTEVAGA